MSLLSRIALSAPAAPARVSARGMATVSDRLTSIVNALPHKEAVRYDKQQNIKWTMSEIKRYSDALASGMLEMGIAPGSTLISWLPPNNAETHVLQLAAARAGYVVGTLSPSVKDVAVVSKVLAESNAVAIFHQDNVEEGQYLDIMHETIPEMVMFEHSATKKLSKASLVKKGKAFVVEEKAYSETRKKMQVEYGLPNPGLHKKFPKLEYPVHTGFDQIPGFTNYKHMMLFNNDAHNETGAHTFEGKPVPANSVVFKSERTWSRDKDLSIVMGPINDMLHTPADGDALFFTINEKGERGKMMTHKDVDSSEDWSVVSKILNKEYVEPQN